MKESSSPAKFSLILTLLDRLVRLARPASAVHLCSAVQCSAVRTGNRQTSHQRAEILRESCGTSEKEVQSLV